MTSQLKEWKPEDNAYHLKKKRRKKDSAILTTWKYHSEMKAKKAFSDKYKMREFTVSRISLKEIPKKSA